MFRRNRGVICLQFFYILAQNASQVTCLDDEMKIEIMKSYLSKVPSQGDFSLLDPQCRFQENETHIFYTTKLNKCGTRTTYTLTSTTYSNIVRTVTDANAIIVRYRSIQVPFECDYSLRIRNRRKISSKGGFGTKINEMLRGNGVGVRIKEDTNRLHRSLTAHTPLKIEVHRIEKYLVVLKSKYLKAVEVQLLPDFCYATPVDKGERWMRFTLIEKG